MKNCELFKDELSLKKAWNKRKELFGFKSDEGYTHWACFEDADLALQDKYDRGKLLKHNGKDYVMSLGATSTMNRVLVYVSYISSDGKRHYDSVKSGGNSGRDNFEPADIPDSIMDLARAVVADELIEHLKSMSESLKESLENG